MENNLIRTSVHNRLAAFGEWSPAPEPYVTTLEEVNRRALTRVDSPVPVERVVNDFVTKIVNTAIWTEYWNKNHMTFGEKLSHLSCEQWVAMRLELDRKLDVMRQASEQLFKGKEELANMVIGNRHPKGVMVTPTYWLEVLHRRHYPGQKFHQKRLNGEPSLFEQWVSSNTNKPFFEWITPERLVSLPRVCYMEPVARDNYALSIVDGKFASKDGGLFSTKWYSSLFNGFGHAIYVLGPDGVFYAAHHNEGSFHHTSFFDGGMLIGAGDMSVKDGILSSISNCSGHYRPGKESMLDVLEFLRCKGVDLTNVGLEMMVDGNVTRIYGSALKFLECDGNCTPTGYKGVSLDFIANDQLSRVTFTDKVMTLARKLAVLNSMVQSGFNLTDVELVDGNLRYLSAAKYSETGGACPPCPSAVERMVRACRTTSSGGESFRIVSSQKLKSMSADDIPPLTSRTPQREGSR
ncbi:MAG: hypothetical protein Q8K75_06190 [Chlamydiales bacterium]|nr:hypothetical protein [Chlamydiales bacterium]